MSGAAPHTVHFNILGSLEIWAGRHRLRLGGPIQERILAALLLEPGRVIPMTRLMEAAWDEDPPATAVHQVRKAVADLRRRVPDGSSLFLTEGRGYRAVVAEDQIDVGRFARLTAQARRELAAGASAGAAELLRTALALWRGPVLADQASRTITAAALALEERRLAAAEQLFQLRLDGGEAGELVGDLREVIADHPLRETLREQLMLALYRSGRAAEAVEEYGRVRDLLAEELGIDPGPQLVRLYEAILRDSVEPAVPEPEPEPEAEAAPALSPCTLPYDLSDFTGREEELQQLLAYAAEPADGTRIVAIDGMGGSGKTSLAVRGAHQLVDRYPDGQLYYNLRGYSPGENPLAPSAVLGALLRSLGVPDQRIPEDEGGRSALWRATAAGRRLLLLLDNALDSAQVLPLLPASPGCLVVVTSRARLVDVDGADWISLRVMSPQDSTALLMETLGEQRMATEPEAVAELAELCGRLPLAMRIASARLRNRPRWTVQYLVDRLCDETRRLDELSSGERSVAATIQLSYQAMEERHRVAFRLLGLMPGKEIDAHAGAALFGTDTRTAEDILERLLDVHLVLQQKLGRYCQHDLVRGFTQSLRSADTEAADRAAVERLLDYYVAASEQACALLFPSRSGRAAQLPASAATLPPVRDAGQAEEWLGREHRALLSAVGLAHERGLDRHAVHLARDVIFYLNLRGYFEEYEQVAQLAVDSARRQGDPSVLRSSLSNLTSSHWKLGRFRDGLKSAEESLQIACALGDRHGQAVSFDQLGLLHSYLGNLREGSDHLARSIDLHENVMRKAMALSNLSTVCCWLGEYRRAAEAAEEAVALHGRGGEHVSQIPALNDLAIARLALGEPEQAKACLERALAVGDESSMPEDVALALALSADAEQRTGRRVPASAHGREAKALELVRARGTTVRCCEVENIVGRLHQRRGAYAEALRLHESALLRADSIEYRVALAHAHDGIARAALALGDTCLALRHRSEADGLFDAMGMPADVH
ncbi:BTAD domain-containing putative transcriptional regulator [Streptomyces sp. NPDC004232]|uniref:AfsR/SARP family transcriptional regulator n=1 Tax=Streptomyces sp. NPDC004232 TaxID=3154454 RepID=UPI0033B8BDF7